MQGKQNKTKQNKTPCQRVAQETRDDSVCVRSGVSTPGPTSTQTWVRAAHHLNDEPQSGTLCCMGPQSREGLHSILSFMRRFWQQFTHGGSFKQNSGCEWISATNQFCPKLELAINCQQKMLRPQTIGVCQQGRRAATISGRRTLLKQSASPP